MLTKYGIFFMFHQKSKFIWGYTILERLLSSIVVVISNRTHTSFAFGSLLARFFDASRGHGSLLRCFGTRLL